jgi:hypothetical protein
MEILPLPHGTADAHDNGFRLLQAKRTVIRPCDTQNRIAGLVIPE